MNTLLFKSSAGVPIELVPFGIFTPFYELLKQLIAHDPRFKRHGRYISEIVRLSNDGYGNCRFLWAEDQLSNRYSGINSILWEAMDGYREEDSEEKLRSAYKTVFSVSASLHSSYESLLEVFRKTIRNYMISIGCVPYEDI